ncbi:MAG TPA: HEPN domain-containing protein [Candidatus Nanoarchaeia archaeon]|nr:HEPN domain-containing protein [Candidatus Nanoarchaeia archaeon]
MKEYDLHQLLESKEKLNSVIRSLQEKEIFQKQKVDSEEIKGHLMKARHNLRFVSENIKLQFYDWAVTGCYYASYHAALSLILTKGYASKNHLATLCILIKEFYKTELNEDDLEAFSEMLDYQDVLFYVESKNKREDATYSTKIVFNQKEVDQLKLKAVLFVHKIEGILDKGIHP